MPGDARWPRMKPTNAWVGASKPTIVRLWKWGGISPAPTSPLGSSMVDFVKIRLRGHRHRHYRRALREHPALGWIAPNHHVHYPPNGCTAVAEWRNGWCFYADDTDVLEMRGSFHRLCHGDNWQDFTQADYARTLQEFCDFFKLFEGSLVFLNIEFGLNVIPPVPTKEVLPRVLFHRTTRPVPMLPPANGIVVVRKGHYRLKMYDKAMQFGLPGELMRFEVHLDRMARLKPLGILNADDLLDPSKWLHAEQFVLAKFQELFLLDTEISTDLVSQQQAQMLAQAEDWSSWIGLRPNGRYKRRKSLERLYAMHSDPCIRGELMARMSEKFKLLRTF